jgi:hypothetical protein
MDTHGMSAVPSAGRADAPASPAAEATPPRPVMEISTVPRDCATDGAHAPHQADPRGNPGDHAGDATARMTPPAPDQPRTRRPAGRRSRPQRWRDAVVELLALQSEYAQWLAALPDSLSDSPTAEALEAIVDLDLTELADIEPPRGYGRD